MIKLVGAGGGVGFGIAIGLGVAVGEAVGVGTAGRTALTLASTVASMSRGNNNRGRLIAGGIRTSDMVLKIIGDTLLDGLDTLLTIITCQGKAHTHTQFSKKYPST